MILAKKSLGQNFLVDQNILYAKIMIKPARAIEYIAIDFAVLNTGASFDD